jgi:hypothetical protein
VRIDGRLITEVEPRRAVRAGITYAIDLPGMAPFFEQHLTRAEVGYTLDEWEAIGPRGRAHEIGLRRVRLYIDLHQADAARRQAEREAKHGVS